MFRMKLLFVFISMLFLFIRCSGDAENVDITIQEVDSEDSMEKVEKPIYTDTTHTFIGLGEFNSNGDDSFDTIISIKQKNYRLHLECELDSNNRLIYNESYPNKNVLHQYTTVGYQGYYEISLFDGETTIFKTKLTKEDFKKAYYGLVLESGAYLPQLIQYNKAFNSIIFQVPFYINESDVMCDALLVMGMDGKVKIIDYLSSSSGNSANNDVQITPNQSLILSRNSIYSPNGNSIDFTKNSKSNLMGTDLFDDCLLVVYEFDPKDHPKNAYLKDYKGKTLLNFKYQGWSGGLGYSIIRKKVKDAYYFIDEVNKHLVQVKKVDNKWMNTNLPFSEMIEFDGEEYLADQLVDLTTETRESIFYFNTKSDKIRKITPEEY